MIKNRRLAGRASGDQVDSVGWAATFPTGWRSNVAAILLPTTPFSQRAEPLAAVVQDFPKKPHQTRDNTDFPHPLRNSDARLRFACHPLVRLNGAAHEKGKSGDSDPVSAAGVARGRTKLAVPVAARCPRAGRSLSPQ